MAVFVFSFGSKTCRPRILIEGAWFCPSVGKKEMRLNSRKKLWFLRKNVSRVGPISIPPHGQYPILERPNGRCRRPEGCQSNDRFRGWMDGKVILLSPQSGIRPAPVLDPLSFNPDSEARSWGVNLNRVRYAASKFTKRSIF